MTELTHSVRAHLLAGERDAQLRGGHAAQHHAEPDWVECAGGRDRAVRRHRHGSAGIIILMHARVHKRCADPAGWKGCVAMQVRRDRLPSGCYQPGRPGTERLTLYEERLATFQDGLAATLGSHTAHVLLHRAIGQVAPRHPALHLIHNGHCGLCSEVLQTGYGTWLEGEIAIEAAFNDLVVEMLGILSRLLGRDIAERLCADGHL
jgi:hypothetical protein